MKKILIATLISILFVGCVQKSYNCNQNNCKTNCVVQSFNDETYVWENFVSSTNHIDKID